MEIAIYLILFGLLAFFIISNITLRSEHSTGGVILGAFLNGIPIGFLVFLALFSARQWYQRAAYILAGLAAMVLILGFIGRWWHWRNIALWAAIAVAGAGAVFAADRYDAYLESIRVPEHFDYTTYSPHREGTLAARLDGPADLLFTDQLPRMDGATALYPVYAAFAQAVYPASIGELEPHQLREIINCSTTRNAYSRIVDGDCDIIFVAGPSKEQEAYAKEHGVELRYIPIGREAFVFFVHPNNPLNGLTLEQIRDIYAGRTIEWDQLGINGLGGILAYQRSEGSGSQTALERFVMRDTPLMPAPTEMRQGGMGDMIEAVSDYHNHRNAIGYSFRFYSTVLMKDFSVKLLAVNGIEPTLDNIENGTYPLASDFYAVIRSDADEATLDLIEWIQGPQGQELIQRTGYTPVEVP